MTESMYNTLTEVLENPHYTAFAISYHHGLDVSGMADSVMFHESSVDFHLDSESLFSGMTIPFDEIANVERGNKNMLDVSMSKGGLIRIIPIDFDEDEDEE